MYPWLLQIDVVTKVLGLQLFRQGVSVEVVMRAARVRARVDTNSIKSGMKIRKSWLMAHLKAMMIWN